jgi:hypothetical protein
MSGVVRLRECIAVACALSVIGGALGVWSHQPTLAQDKPSSDPVTYLEKISSGDVVPYHARQLIVYMGLPQSAAVLDIRSTPTTTFVRSEAGSDLVRLWRRPGTGIVSAAQGAVRDDGVEAQVVRAADVMAKYEVTMGPEQKMLGVDVVPLTLVRRSDQLMTERMYINPGSGVVYRRELYSTSGHLVGLSTIIDMRWGETATAERFEPGSSPPAHAWAVDAGGAPRLLPYGYALDHTYAVKINGRTSTQWVYNDGLHALSVFATSGGLRVPRGFTPAGVAGAHAFTGPGPGTWTWEGGGRTWVVVAEEPDIDGAQLIGRFPHDTPSAWARMGSLWSRAFSAIGRVLR